MVPFTYNVRSMMVRKVTTIATMVGIALVVFVFAASLMLGEGVNRVLATSGRADTVIVLRKGSDAELTSSITNEQLSLLRGRPEVAQTAGSVIGESVIIVTADLADGSGGISNVLVRGMPPEGMSMRPEAKIASGRAPTPGTNEVIVGKAIAGRFKGIAQGQTFDLRRNRPLVVVGTFTADGTSYESEVWGDLDVIRTSLGRSTGVSSARVRLTSKDSFDSFRASIEGDKRFNLKVQREPDYYKKQSEQTAAFLQGMGIAVAIMFSLAAMIGAAITMNAAVANRSKEIGTLRALGFSRKGILLSFVLEAIFLTLLGGLIGLAFVMLLSLVTFPMMNFATFSEIVIGFKATPNVVVSSVIFSMFMGLLGGLIPAIRAARVSPIEAMRN
jgi:putative ABC transport system permease protein